MVMRELFDASLLDVFVRGFLAQDVEMIIKREGTQGPKLGKTQE